ncbi:hypothetical protein [Clostridium magnum]|uniref:Uncharacterized protein n=1 Tax=Clostridium magnum DSM 2767 TaxID=1121326 RepID=A0A161YPC9_9CLOT|nr:hypothetical protein [Clostridium magnum]KZL92642.1 hypothetical protein CLMAG_24560 [Clostridium magnum DSM 2767]SHI24062.1 hypothetical protein SAMN02745944_03508 [Clostridium magnum DSM 2767]
MCFCNFGCNFCFYSNQFYPLPLMRMPIGTPSTSQASTVPPGPPPHFVPNKEEALYGSIDGSPSTFFDVSDILPTCIFQYVYMYLNNGLEFWSWVNNIVGNNVYGWRWNATNWVPLTMDIENIQGVACYEPTE